MRNSLTRGAFTLIELLIVVAIIAILAAIAVPNLLEAQVRSKVSRVKADMRSYATALEAYAVDSNDYPPLIKWSIDPEPIVPLEMALVPLSTPIGYMSNALVPEPFNAHRGWILYRGWDVVDAGGPPPDAATRMPLYLYFPLPNDELTSSLTNILIIYLSSNSIPINGDEVRTIMKQRWFLASPGPDTFFRYDQLLAVDPGLLPAVGIFDQAASLTLPRLNVIYDPTNGTVSRGDLGRGGAGILIEKK